ncbi:MAG: cytochrome ubiquinol oxidase subunit I [Candidatus Dadabacteria bacterium]|nr:MAG: cytochrome ubiquinol oxidase subunit I [Candidatus Dadabacteria bacterium]
MTDLLAARSLMAMSLAFHIVFAIAGMGMPVLMAAAEWRWLRHGDELARELAVRWSRGVAILFAIGAVSGTILSFELGLLWPEFMRHAGPVIGMPFSLEGFAFFVEAICIGIYLYGWERTSARAHWWAGIGVAVSGLLSGAFVVCANAWMNAPAGFDLVDGRFVNVRPLEAMFNPMAGQQVLHMTIAAILALSGAVAGIHAWRLMRDPENELHRLALRIALPVAAIAAVLQPLSGDYSAKVVARQQPVKFAAMEAHFETRAEAPLHLGGWPDVDAQVVRGAIEVPGMLSVLAFGDPSAVVVGLADVPRALWPPVAVVHIAFQIMVALGLWMALLYLLAARRLRRGRLERERPWLLALACSGPAGIVAVQAGWIVTEVGRQPWIIYDIMNVADAVTPQRGLWWAFLVAALLYAALSAVVILALRRHIAAVEGSSHA